jgi:hypothetical protein
MESEDPRGSGTAIKCVDLPNHMQFLPSLPKKEKNSALFGTFDYELSANHHNSTVYFSV